jgi:hypothetical protein
MKLREVALAALNGVGSKLLGEWHHARPMAYHIRRRLTAEEQTITGPAIDIRGSAEARNRVNALFVSLGDRVPPTLLNIAREEARGM